MKSLSVVLVFTFSLACALANSPGLNYREKDNEECKAGSENQHPERKIFRFISGGSRVELSREEQCILSCLLSKSEFFDNNGNLRDGSGYLREILKLNPTYVKYSDVMMAQIFQVVRSAKAIDDKCERALIIFTEISWIIKTLHIASGIEMVTGTKDKTINILDNIPNVDQEISRQREQYFGFFDALTSDEATWGSKGFNISASAFCVLSKAMLTQYSNLLTIWHTPSAIGLKTELACELES